MPTSQRVGVSDEVRRLAEQVFLRYRITGLELDL